MECSTFHCSTLPLFLAGSNLPSFLDHWNDSSWMFFLKVKLSGIDWAAGLEKIMIFILKIIKIRFLWFKSGFFDLNQIFKKLCKQVIQGTTEYKCYDNVINDKVYVGFKKATEDKEQQEIGAIDLLHAWCSRWPSSMQADNNLSFS